MPTATADRDCGPPTADCRLRQLYCPMGPAVRRLLPYVLRYRRAFVLGLTCVLVTTAIQLLSPWILKHAIDDLNGGVTRQKLAMYAGLLLGVAMVSAVFRFLMRRILIGASRDIEFDLRNAFFARLQQMPLAYYQARRTGDLMSRATNDLNAVRMMVGPAGRSSLRGGAPRRTRPMSKASCSRWRATSSRSSRATPTCAAPRTTLRTGSATV